MTDLEFIRKFAKISVSKACRDNHVNISNLWSGRAKPEKIHTVRMYLQAKIAQLTVEDYFTNVEQEDHKVQS